MGFGAYLSYRLDWITKEDCDRIMKLISTFGLSLWHDGYLNSMSKEELFILIDEYQEYCQAYPRNGLGVDPLCSDVGLEDPSTVGSSIAAQEIQAAEELSAV